MAPNVDPAPMLAASIDAKIRPGPEAAAGDEELAAAADEPRRPDAEADDGDGVDDEQGEVSARECRVLTGTAPAPCRDRARRAGRRAARLDDRADHGFGQHVGRERADDGGVGLALPSAGRQGEHGVAVAVVCDGLIARARPSSAISATRLMSALRHARVGRHDRDRGVLAGPRAGGAADGRRCAAGRARRPAPCRRACARPATTWPLSGSTMSPTALTATSAADDETVRQRHRWPCRCRPSWPCPRRPSCRPWRRRRRRRCPRPPGRWCAAAAAL